jgi:hypothetical protein
MALTPKVDEEDRIRKKEATRFLCARDQPARLSGG